MRNLRLAALLLLASIPTFQLANAALPKLERNVRTGNVNVSYLSKFAAAPYDWPEFDFNAQHSGNNTLETIITPANVNSLQRLFQVSLPSVADGAAAYLGAVNTSGGVRNLIFLTTRAGHIVALDALTGEQVWTKQNAAGSCRINNGFNTCYTTSSPAIDPGRQYVYSYGLDGKVHKYQVGDGTEITTGGFPELATSKGFDEKGSSALSIATDTGGKSYLYVTNGGYPGDRGDYQGHVTAISLADGVQRVFNTMCSDQAVHFVAAPGTPDCADVQSAIWARPGVIYDPDTNKIYMATGNGTFNPGKHYWGDTVFALSPNGSGANGNPLDTFTPTNFQQLQNQDADLGSTAPAILPAPANSTVQHLAVQGGKDSRLRLLNLDNLSGQAGTGHTGGEVGTVINVPQGGEVLTQPAVWVNPNDGSSWVFVANNNGISGLKLTLDSSNTPELQSMWQNGNTGSSPIVANGVLFYVGSRNIWALDPTTSHLLWNDNQIGGVHWESPIVANGMLYVTDENSNLNAYTLNSNAGTVTPSPTPTVTLTPSITPTPTVTPTPTITPTPVDIFLPFILKRD